MKILLFVSSILTALVGCREECHVTKNCIENVLEKQGMVAYTGQELGCSTFLTLYEFDGKQYFMLGNHCTDMIVYPFDCEGNKLCETNDEKCQQYLQSTKYIGVVGIKVTE
jgi:hypothetical protein